MQSIPLASRFYKNKSLPASAQNLVNMYVDILDPDAKSRIVCHLRPGKTLKVTPGNGPVRGFEEMNGLLYVVSGTELYEVDSGYNATLLGTIPGVANVGMAVNLVNQLMIVNGTSTGYVYSTDSGLASVTLTGPAYTVAHSDGYLIFDYSGTNNWFISSNTDATVFDSTETGATNDNEDNVLAVKRSQNRVVVFGEKSIEGFYVATSLDFPYQKDRGVSLTKGTLSRWSIAEEDEILFWLGDDREVYMMKGLQSQRISDPSISYAISELTVINDAEGYAFTFLAHTFYVLSFPTEDKSYMYDASTGLWSQIGELDNGNIVRDIAHNYINIFDTHLVGDHTNGNIYELDADVYTDNGTLIRWEMTLPPIHADQEPLFIGQLLVSLESGVGLTTGQGSDPQIFLSRSDDAKTWPNERWASVGKIGKYKHKVIFNRNGYTEDQVFFRLAGSDPVKWAINGVYIDI